jgi:Asp-tRNA(Asn)/Glu-tRNA(Gln) amidotransferase A subunit family amidase
MLQALRTRQVSATELLDRHLLRIERYNPQLNAIATPNYDAARQSAQAADEARAWGKDRPLLGLPYTIKDCIYVKGLTTTGGVPERLGIIDEEDAPSAAAGAVLLGKTNVPPYDADWQSDNPIFGRSNNPWDPERTPGGSTGGGAAAVAAGLTPLESGGDMGGSIRIPAALCGIYGHKPSELVVPRRGSFPGSNVFNAAHAMYVQGPLARTAADLEKVDCVRLYVPDLDAGLAFYRDQLGHALIWRTQEQVDLRMPGTDADLILHTEPGEPEIDLQVQSADDAATRFQEADGQIVVLPFDIQIGRCVVVAEPWRNQYVLLDASRGHWLPMMRETPSVTPSCNGLMWE